MAVPLRSTQLPHIMTDQQALLLEIIDIARRAGEAILHIYESREDLGIEAKADDTPLTKADRAANTLIVEELKSLSFQAPIISEENELVDYSVRKQYTRFWLVDPLDGTKEFIKRNGEFTVNIALIEDDQPVLGVVYVPVRQEMYYSRKGAGAFKSKAGYTEQLQAATFRLTDTGLKVVASRTHRSAATLAFIDSLAEPTVVSCGSSLKLLLLAAGEAHIYPRLGVTMEWDIAAAQIVLEEAGGKVVVEETGQPLAYNKADMHNPFFIAYGAVQ